MFILVHIANCHFPWLFFMVISTATTSGTTLTATATWLTTSVSRCSLLTPPENTFLLKHIPPTNTCLKHIRLLLLQKNTFSLEFKLEHVVHYICLRTAQTAQIREQQQQLDFEEINLFSALFIVACLSSEPFHISRPSANSLPCGPSTGGSRVQTFWKLRYTV